MNIHAHTTRPGAGYAMGAEFRFFRLVSHTAWLRNKQYMNGGRLVDMRLSSRGPSFRH